MNCSPTFLTNRILPDEPERQPGRMAGAALPRSSRVRDPTAVAHLPTSAPAQQKVEAALDTAV